MKNDNAIVKMFFLSFFVILVGGCSVTKALFKEKKESLPLVSNKADKVSLLATDVYLPKREVNEETKQLLPYVKMDNPYVQQDVQVDANAVKVFIEAKRAIKNKQYKVAEEKILEITRTDQSLSGPWILLGDMASTRNHHDQAIEYYVKAITTNENNVNAYIKLAKSQRKKGKFTHAQNTYAKALSIWKDFPEGHLNLGVLYDIYLNQPEKAQRHIEAYQFLTDGNDKKVEKWLTEIISRTGLDIQLKVDKKPAVSG